ncbi:acyl-CoA-binding domain-containing protein 6 isoform X1 [Panulirus ornatus]|uniref:acyl-CoA-binding domain-containing protein 6 isoform X1 n=1 Tax=Panulirus ornatus TaxID=150431 RepID=UPI003A86926A
MITSANMDDLDGDSPVEDLETVFNKAAAYLPSVATSLPQDKLLFFYARYKQANEGACNTPKPGFFDFKGRQKWEAWKNLGGMSKKDAMKEYVSAIADVDPDWEIKVESEGGPRTSWVRVSCLLPEKDDIKEEEKNSFDWVKENNVEKIKNLRPETLSEKDENGMTLLHWAADRGYVDIAKYLLEKKINVNAQDVEGQTALHYAAFCGHLETIQVLLNHGADPTVQDADGLRAEECGDDEGIRKFFHALE